MAIDFYGVRLAGRIRQFVAGGGKGPGRVVELWTENQDTELTEDIGALAFVSEINVKYKMGENCSIALVLTPPFEDALVFMQSELIRAGIGRLEVELGYTTGTFTGSGVIAGTTLPFSGLLMKPDVSIGSDITITLHAQGVGYQMNVVGGVETEAFPANTTYAEAVRKTLEKYVTTDGSSSGLRITDLYKYVPAKVQDPQSGDDFFKIPQTSSVTKGKNGKPDANVTPGIIHKGPRNDWWFVKETVQELGYDLFIEGNEIFIVEKSFWFVNGFGQRSGRKHFKLRGNVDPSLNMFPILSFQSPTEGVWMQPGIGRLLTLDVDANKEKEDGEKAKASADETPIARGKESADPDDIVAVIEADIAKDKERDRIAAKLMPGDPNDPEVKKRMRAHWIDLNLQSGIQGQFSTVGIPTLTPGETVQVSGFEPFKGGVDESRALFNGVYGVIEVNHKVGVGGWDTSFLGIMGYFPKEFVNAARAVKTAQKREIDENARIITQITSDNKQSVAKNQKLKEQPTGRVKTPKDGTK